MPRLQRSYQRRGGFVGSVQGSVSIELCVLLALIVACVLAGATMLGGQLRGSFALAGDPLDQSGVVRASGGAADRAIEVALPVPAEAEEPAANWNILLLVLANGTLLLLTGIWICRRTPPTAEASAAADLPVAVHAKFVGKRQAILHFLSHDLQRLAHGQMLVEQLMTKSLLTIGPGETVATLRNELESHGLRHALVCTAEGMLVGIISDRDLLTREGSLVSDIMTPDPAVVAPETLVTVAITSLLANRCSCLPVVSDGRLCGIITVSDLLMALQCTLRLTEQLATDLAREAADEPAAVACSA